MSELMLRESARRNPTTSKDVVNMTAMAAMEPVISTGIAVPVNGVDSFRPADWTIAANIGAMGAIGKALLYRTEKNVPASVIMSYPVERDARDPLILAALRNRASTSLWYYFQLLVRQAKGPESPAGILLTNGCSNVLYVHVSAGIIPVDASWCSTNHYWRFGTDSTSPRIWYRGDMVFAEAK